MTFTLDTTLGELMDHPQAKAALEQHMPGVTTNPMIVMVRGLSLNAILSMPQAAQMGLTKEKVDAFLEQANKLV